MAGEIVKYKGGVPARTVFPRRGGMNLPAEMDASFIPADRIPLHDIVELGGEVRERGGQGMFDFRGPANLGGIVNLGAGGRARIALQVFERIIRSRGGGW